MIALLPHDRRRFPTRLRWRGLSLAGIALVLTASGPVRAGVTPARITVEPPVITLSDASARQLVAVTGHFPDGAVRDLTGEARFTVEADDVATVGADGVVRAAAEGRTRLVVAVDGVAAEVPIQVVQARWTRPVSYRHDVAALLSKAGCNMGACHGNINGKGGFRLSLRGEDPAFDFDMLMRDAHGRRVDRTRPDRSLVVLKPTGMLPHEGGLRFDARSPEAETLRGWIASGAADDRDTAPALVGLSVFPEHRMIAAPGRSQQLVVTATFADGSVRDVTRQASYDLNDPTLATISEEGQVTVQDAVEVAVAVRYLDGRAVSRLAFLADRPDFVWNGPEPRNRLDESVFAKLKALKINPSEPVPDHVFLRRAYLDAIGVLPTPEEARAFLDDPAPDKRARLVAALLDRPEFADFWALKWADLLRNEEKTMGEKGVWVFQRWLRDQVARDLPLDEFARRIVTARGSTWGNPPASFYRTNRDPTTAAETVGQVFLGLRLQCAKCHNHPSDVWTQDDYFGLAAFFGNIGRKQINNERRDQLDTHEINSDEIIYFEARRPRIRQPRSGQMMTPTPLPMGRAELDLGNDPDALYALADWLTRDNPQFTRNLANRVWFHLMGRGIVEPVDDFRDSNPPANPELLDVLTAAFVEGGLRLKPLVERIMTSRVYELDWQPNDTNADDEINFARSAVKLLPAEVLFDALGHVLDKPGAFANAPEGTRAVQLPGARMGGEFLQVFGKPERLLTCECERSEATTLAQAFQLINGEAIRAKLEADDNRIGRLLTQGAEDEAILSELYLAALAREPTVPERQAALAHVAGADDRRKAWEDVAWAIVNSKEFLLRR